MQFLTLMLFFIYTFGLAPFHIRCLEIRARFIHGYRLGNTVFNVSLSNNHVEFEDVTLG